MATWTTPVRAEAVAAHRERRTAAEAERYTESLRYGLTQAELVVTQLWLLRRDASLRRPRGTRRRADREARMPRWRPWRGWPKVKRCPEGR